MYWPEIAINSAALNANPGMEQRMPSLDADRIERGAINPSEADFIVLDTPDGSCSLAISDMHSMGASVSVRVEANIFEEPMGFFDPVIPYVAGPHHVTITIEIDANKVRYVKK